MNRKCKTCCGIGWVCKTHPRMAFDTEIGCACGDAIPCRCNDRDPPDTSEVVVLEIVAETTLH